MIPTVRRRARRARNLGRSSILCPSITLQRFSTGTSNYNPLQVSEQRMPSLSAFVLAEAFHAAPRMKAVMRVHSRRSSVA